ncbi:MAG: alkaline phosphatase family protein, partial [Phycisphaerae bacterium]
MFHRSVIWPLLSLLALVAGCAQGTSAYRVLGAGVQRPERAVVLFFVDGMDRRVFHRLVEQGDLPNFERIFVTGGVGVEHAIASMPAITYPNAVSLITGRFPGHHGVLGNRWFDRLTLIDQDYGSAATYRSVNRDFESATLYELMPDRLTVNVQGHTRRGVTHTFDHWALSGIDWFLGSYTSVDQRVGACIDRVVNLARREGRWPTVLTAYFPGVDEVGHRYGPGSKRYLDALRNADRQIGRIYDGVEASGMGSRTYYVLVSDHGLVATPSARSVDLNAWLEDRCKLRVYRGHVEDARYDRRRWRLRRFDAVVVDGAFRRAAVHLRGSAGWAGSADDALIERVLRPGTQTLCGTGFQPVEPADHLCGTG